MRGRHTGHDYQRAHHVALGPRFQRHRPWRGGLQGARVGGVPDHDAHFEEQKQQVSVESRDRIRDRQRGRKEGDKGWPGMVVYPRLYTKRREHKGRTGWGEESSSSTKADPGPWTEGMDASERTCCSRNCSGVGRARRSCRRGSAFQPNYFRSAFSCSARPSRRGRRKGLPRFVGAKVGRQPGGGRGDDQSRLGRDA
jgi:hypothetical protein